VSPDLLECFRTRSVKGQRRGDLHVRFEHLVVVLAVSSTSPVTISVRRSNVALWTATCSVDIRLSAGRPLGPLAGLVVAAGLPSDGVETVPRVDARDGGDE